MQIAGSECSSCRRPIVLANEGKGCDCCGSALHLVCETREHCPNCGSFFQGYSPQKADASDAFDPNAKLSRNVEGPLLTVFLALMVILLAYYLITIA